MANPPPEAELRLHATLSASRANGPGLRAVVWFQGCTLACKGCFNPETHAPDGGLRRTVGSLIEEIAETPGLTGLTVTGGEPFQQPAALLSLLAGLRAQCDLSTLVFSGYRLEEIEAMEEGPATLGHIDVLIAGRYVPARHLGMGLLGSANQSLHFLTPRHSPADILNVPAAEIQIDPRGRISVTGIAPPSGLAFPG